MLDASYYQKTDEIIAMHTRGTLIDTDHSGYSGGIPLSSTGTAYLCSKTDRDYRGKSVQCGKLYENFSFEPKGKYVIKVCDGTACHVRKSIPILEALYKELGLNEHKHTSDDMLFTVETVSCLGACGLAPAITVNDEVHPKMSPEKVIKLLEELRGEEK